MDLSQAPEVNSNTVVIDNGNSESSSFHKSSSATVSPAPTTWVRFEGDNGEEPRAADHAKGNLNSNLDINEDSTSINVESPVSSPSSISVVATIEPSAHSQSSATSIVIRDPLRSTPSPAKSPVPASNQSRSSSVPPATNWTTVDLNTIEVINDQVVINSTPVPSTVSDRRQSSTSSSRAVSVVSNASGPNGGGQPGNEAKSEWTTALIRASTSPGPQFKNGDVLVSLLPVNSGCSWLTPATFKPELVPEELMSPQLALTVEDYVSALTQLVNDFRFTLYMIMYKRVLVTWIGLGFILLMSLLFSGVRGLPLFGGGLLWLIMNALGIFVCMWCKFKLYRLLEKCMAAINEHFYKSNVILGVDDRGHLSCHKVNLQFIYFDTSPCLRYLNELAALTEAGSTIPGNLDSRAVLDLDQLDIDNEDIVVAGQDGSQPRSLSRREKIGEKLLLRYSQRWAKEFVRKRIELSMPLHPDGTGTLPPTALPPRHCVTSRCPCQFIEEHLRFKPLSKCGLSDLFG